MAVAFGSQGTVTSYASHTNITLVAPASIANGDLLLAFIFAAANPTSLTVSAATGWTGMTGSPSSVTDVGGLNGKFYVFYKIAASESGNYTFNHSTENSCGVVFRYTGVDNSIPFSPTPTLNTGSGDTSTATGFTTTAANTMVVFVEQDWGDNNNDSVVPTGTTPTFTERLDETIMYVCDGTLASAGATGDQTHFCNSVGNPWAVYLIGLAPSSGSSVTTTASAGAYALTGSAAGENVIMPAGQAGELA